MPHPRDGIQAVEGGERRAKSPCDRKRSALSTFWECASFSDGDLPHDPVTLASAECRLSHLLGKRIREGIKTNICCTGDGLRKPYRSGLRKTREGLQRTSSSSNSRIMATKSITGRNRTNSITSSDIADRSLLETDISNTDARSAWEERALIALADLHGSRVREELLLPNEVEKTEGGGGPLHSSLEVAAWGSPNG